MLNATPSLRGTGRAKSCTRCRQVKLACDARKTSKGPCSRCKSKNLECRFDANFKRLPTRKIAEEISQEVHALRSEDPGSYAKSHNLTSSNNFDSQEKSGNQTTKLNAVSAVSGEADNVPWFSSIESDASCLYTLGTLKLEAETVIELFQYFDANYRTHANFLRPVTSLSDLLSSSPLLFWTIILVASQEHDQFTIIYQEVATEYEQLLSYILRRAIQQVEVIHALLLLCLWPMSHSHYFQNPAWNYIGLAVHAAIQLRCHSPLEVDKEQHGWHGFGLLADGEVSAVDLARTWLGCLRVGTAVATFSGLPLPMSTQFSNKSIDVALRTVSKIVPAWWSILFSMIKIVNTAVETLDSTDDHAVYFSVASMFIEKLDELKESHLDVWEPELEIEWCNARLYLFALTFTTSTNTEPSQNMQLRIRRQRVLEGAFTASSSLISEFQKLGELRTSDLEPHGLLKFVPQLYATSLFNATTFLFRFMATFIAITPVQRSRAMSLIIEAHKIFQSYPERREFTRAAIHIEALIDVLKLDTPVGMSELAVRSKLGASVMFDAIFHACRQRNIDPNTGRPLALHRWKTVSDTFARRLPEVSVQQRENESHTGRTDFEADNAEIVSQSFGEQNSQWWEQWDSYIDLFQLGNEPLGMDLDQILEG